ncbi:MAG: phosphate-starvation-inducible PsiE family protein [Arcobacteraceae bacterium]|nr:phosphate-starvation-inducible PsiE family protein [Arcobacteraceae bacterium]
MSEQEFSSKFSRFFKDKLYIELIIATFLFSIALITNSLLEFIIYMLYFIIFLEIVRAVMSFIREQRVRIGILIDVFIILALREFIVNVVKINKEDFDSFDALFNSATNFHILIFSGVILFLFLLRYIAKKTSPDNGTNRD